MDDLDRDERAILRVLSEYCFRVDDGEFVGLLDCFTTDAEFVFAGRTRVGHDALLRFFEATGAPQMRGKHMVANTVVDVEGATARSTSDFVFFARTESALAPILAGRYQDELRRDGGRWRLSRREATTI